jgi:threonine dehydrogenase-like Zn-dependent dehydrogenase
MKQDRINEYPIPKTMKAWVLGDREELTLVEKPVPEPGSAEVLVRIVRNSIYVFGIRGEGKSATHRAAALMAQKRFDAKMIHTHTFSLSEVPTAIKYARERVEDAIKVVVKIREN